MQEPTSCTERIFKESCELFEKIWRGEPLRHIGVSLTEFESEFIEQLNFLNYEDNSKKEKLDKTIDIIRKKYGEDILKRSTLLK